ncbi:MULTISPECIES: hypothetical protein [Paraburkholderia]|uniref:hypothetical protein n=1 Tax=Paraburkholderia TaxID=1822464 RepID=UPI0037439DD6
MVAQVHIHTMGNGLYKSEAQSGEDPDVKAFAERGVRVGTNHLQHATQMLHGLRRGSSQ